MSNPLLPVPPTSAAPAEPTDIGAFAPVSGRRQLCHIGVSALAGGSLPREPNLRLLFESVVEWGVLQPLVVRQSGSGYEVVDGRKRLAAAVAAGLTEVPCLVVEIRADETAIVSEALNAFTRPAPEPARTPSAAGPLPPTVLADLEDARSAIYSGLAMTDAAPPGLRRRVTRLLVATELQHLGWIVDAIRLTVAPAAHVPCVQTCSAGAILRGLTSAYEADCELGGIDARLVVEPPDLSLSSDEEALRVVLSCALGATISIVQQLVDTGLPELVIGAAARDRGVVFSISQNIFGPERYVPPSGRDAPQPAGSAVYAFAAARAAAEQRAWKVAISRNNGGASFELIVPSH